MYIIKFKPFEMEMQVSCYLDSEISREKIIVARHSGVKFSKLVNVIQ